MESIFAMSSPGLLATDSSKLQVPTTPATIGSWTFSVIKRTLGSIESIQRQSGSQHSQHSQPSVDSLDIDNDEEGNEAGLETDW